MPKELKNSVLPIPNTTITIVIDRKNINPTEKKAPKEIPCAKYMPSRRFRAKL